MNKEIADKWVAALRSRKYQQTKSVLKTMSGFCCLGVLCEIAPPELGMFDSSFNYISARGNARDVALLPLSVREWSGLKTTEGCHPDIAAVIPVGAVGSLAGANDRGASFAEIADFIEKHWETL